MNRYRAIFPRDEGETPDGDLFFVGVNMLDDPSQVQHGLCAEAVNKDFSEAMAATRKGMQIMNPNDVFTDIHGATVFRNPDDVQRVVILADGGAYYWSPNNAFKAITLPGGVTLSGRRTMTQCFNTLILWRGEEEAPLELRNLLEGFAEINQSPSGDGTEPIPNASRAIFSFNRLLIPHNKDEVAASDFLDYTRYLPTLADFRINQGGSDRLVGLSQFGPNTIICFKDRSIYAVTNVYNIAGVLSDIRLTEVTGEYGCVAPDSVVDAGNLMLFLTEGRGVGALKLNEEGRVDASPEPFSRPIQKLIDRINWTHAHKAVGAYHDNKYYLAVPLDGSTTNNAILVHNFLRGSWMGHWEGDLVKVRDFFVLEYQGRNRLFFTNDSGHVVLMEEGYEDSAITALNPAYTDLLVDTLPTVGDTLQIGGGTTVTVTDDEENTGTTWGCSDLATARANLYSGYNLDGWTAGTNSISQITDGIRVTSANASAPVISTTGTTWDYRDAHSGSVVTPVAISDRIVTRGYRCETTSEKNFTNIEVNLSTWAPSYSISVINDGVSESMSVVGNQTKSRTRYYKFATPDWDETNVNDDHGNSFREDYSVVPGGTGFLAGTGVNPDLHQECAERRRVRQNARYMQVRVENSQGRCAVRTVEVFARNGERKMGVKV